MSQNTQSAAQKRILTWLNDAYAMETEGAKTLERHANAAGDYPQIQSKLQRHAEQTRQHAEKVKGCAQRLGGQPSAAREALGAAIGTARGVATRAAKDTVVKNALADYASEHFEIACYKSLIAAAEREGDRETARVCREILRDEEAMVEFLDEQIGGVTEQFLTKQASEAQTSGNGSSSQNMQETGQKLLKGAQQNALPIVGGLVVAGAGAGLVLTRVLSSSKQQPGNQDAERDVYGSSGYQDESSPYDAVRGGAYSGEATGYTQPLEPYDQPTVTPTQLETDGGSGLQSDLRSGLQSTGLQSSDLQSGGLQGDLPSGTQRNDFQSDVVGADQSPTQSSADVTVAAVETDESPTGDPVADEVTARLKEHRQVDNSDIEVTVEKNGRVTLKGTVDSKDIKQRAEKAVAGVLSVSQVRNQLKVKSQKA